MIEDFFDLAVCKQEFHRFKEMMARYYRPCHKRLLEDLLKSSKVLHVDETEIKLKSEKGYVWVFTTGEEVVYLYRPTREGGFLLDLLKNFTGVLVTDFYAAYDSLGCPQQKCLIHLMRDMNQELLNNPYDQELQLITTPFGTLLRGIVETIDQHGLKRRSMGKYTRDVTKYFKSLASQTFAPRQQKHYEIDCSSIRRNSLPSSSMMGCLGTITTRKMRSGNSPITETPQPGR
jgi:hypothetical protein